MGLPDYHNSRVDFEVLINEVLTEVQNNSDHIVFTCDSGNVFHMYHEQDCCESVLVEDICGDFEDLLGDPILLAEESTSDKIPEDLEDEYDAASIDSSTWTFYRLGTIKGTVVIRWLGQSNGYYSESVSFVQEK